MRIQHFEHSKKREVELHLPTALIMIRARSCFLEDFFSFWKAMVNNKFKKTLYSLNTQAVSADLFLYYQEETALLKISTHSNNC